MVRNLFSLLMMIKSDVMTKGAVFAYEKKYRFVLIRIWDETKPKVTCIGLNQSTANEDTNDQTINNLIVILTKLGYGGFYMTNLFGFISSNPDVLKSIPDPVKNNDEFIKFYAEQSQDVIFCWGRFKAAEYRAKKIIPMFPKALCFGKNQNGTPMHPLALMYNGTVKNPTLIQYKKS